MKSIIILLLGGLLAIRLSANIWRIAKSGERVQQAQIELERAKQEQEELEKRLAEVQTPEFIEREARDKLGFGHDGEVIWVLPRPEEERTQRQLQARSNWQEWWDLYIGL